MVGLSRKYPDESGQRGRKPGQCPIIKPDDGKIIRQALSKLTACLYQSRTRISAAAKAAVSKLPAESFLGVQTKQNQAHCSNNKDTLFHGMLLHSKAIYPRNLFCITPCSLTARIQRRMSMALPQSGGELPTVLQVWSSMLWYETGPSHSSTSTTGNGKLTKFTQLWVG